MKQMIKSKNGAVELHGSLVETMADYYAAVRGMKLAIVSSVVEDCPLKIGEKVAEELARDWLKRGIEIAFMSQEQAEKELDELVVMLKDSLFKACGLSVKGGGDISHG